METSNDMTMREHTVEADKALLVMHITACKYVLSVIKFGPLIAFF